DQGLGRPSGRATYAAGFSPPVPPLGYGAFRAFGRQSVAAGDRGYRYVGSLAGVWAIRWTAASRECSDSPDLPDRRGDPAYVSGRPHRGATARRSSAGETATFRGNAVSPFGYICALVLARHG